MGTMTLSNFRDELTVGLENRTDAALSNARKNRYINFAYRHLTRPSVHRFEETRFRYDLSLVTGQYEYPLSLATVGRRVIAVSDVTYYDSATITATANPRDLPPRRLHWRNRRSTPSAPPGFHTITGVAGDWTLVLNTAPSTNENGHQVRVHYWGVVDALTLDTDTTLLDDYWDLVLVAGSIFFTKWFMGYREEAVADGQFYQGLINEAEMDNELAGEDTRHKNEVEIESYLPSSSY